MVASKEEQESMNWLKRHDLAVFLILAFALSWWVWPLVLLNPEGTPLVPFGPLIAAFIVLALTRGWPGVRDLLASMVRWRVGPGWYAVALLLPIVITLGAIYLNAMLGGPIPTAADLADWYTFPLVFLLTTLVAGPLFEEPGWRGFALPRLQSNYTPLVASLIVGVIWASWHLPELLSDVTGQRPPLQFFVWIVAQSVVYTWVYNGTRGSVLLVILMHGSTNTIGRFLFPLVLGGATYGRLWWLLAALWWAAALAVIAVFGMPRDRAPTMEAPATAASARVR
jgi:membrane protease YdiL (CAAX protease family)